MPKVPISNRQVQEQRLQSRGVSASMPVVGGDTGLAKGLSTLVNQADDIYKAEKAKAYDSTGKEIENKLRDKLNDNLYNPETGFSYIRGKNTQEAYKPTADAYAKFVDETIETVGDLTLKEKLKVELGETYKSRFKSTLEQHTGREMESHYDQVFKSTISSLENDAVNGYTSGLGEGSMTNVTKLQAEVETYGKNRGLDAKTIEQMKMEGASSIHKKVIGAALAGGQDLAAKGYFEKIKGMKNQLTADDSLKLTEILHQSSTLGESQRLTQEVLSKNLSRAESLALMDKLTEGKDPELIDAARSRLNNRINEKKFIEEENQKDLHKNYAVSLEKTRTLDDVKKTQGWLNLTMDQRQSLEAREKQLRLGLSPETDFKTFYDLKLMAATPQTQNKFKRMNLMEVRHKLDDSAFEKVMNLQSALLEGGSKNEKVFRGVQTDMQVANSILKGAGVNDDEDKAAFMSRLDQRKEEFLQEKNRTTISTSELTGLANDLMKEIVIDDGFIFNTNVKKFKLTPEKIDKINDIDEVPQTDREQIKQVLELTGTPVTEDNILQRYKAKLKADIK